MNDKFRADKSLILWNIHSELHISNRIHKYLKGNWGLVTQTRFSNDGKRILGGAEDFNIRFRDAATGQLLQA